MKLSTAEEKLWCKNMRDDREILDLFLKDRKSKLQNEWNLA